MIKLFFLHFLKLNLLEKLNCNYKLLKIANSIKFLKIEWNKKKIPGHVTTQRREQEHPINLVNT